MEHGKHMLYRNDENSKDCVLQILVEGLKKKKEKKQAHGYMCVPNHASHTLFRPPGKKTQV